MSEHLCKGVEMISKGGAAFLVIASNTGHISVPLIRQRFPTLPVLHIADTTVSALLSRCFYWRLGCAAPVG